MGIAESKPCHPNLQNPDILSVVTLSDSCVQRLPLDIDDSPLEKEVREQNIDDFWRDRLTCLENAYLDSLGVTEKEFARVEKKVLSLNPPRTVLACPNTVEDLLNCYVVNAEEPLKCNQHIRKLTLCIDSKAKESAKKNYLEYLRLSRKQGKVCK